MIDRSDDIPSGAAPGYPRYNPQGGENVDASAATAWRMFSRLLGIGLALWMGYLTVAWLRSPHPVGAIAPGILALFFAPSIFSRSDRPPNDKSILVLGPLAALGITILWIAAEATDEPAVREQAQWFSWWGGLVVALFVAAVGFASS